MIKAIKKKLSGKVFLITFVLLVSACSGTFFCILKIMPSSYLDTLNRNAEAQSLELLDTLSTYDNLDKCIKAISDFEIQTGSTVWLDDEYGNTLYPSNVTTEQDMVTADSYVTFDGSNTTDENVVSTEKDTKAYQFSLKNGASYTLVVITDLYVVRQSTEVLLSTFPYVIVMVFILSILCALFYSRFITRPVLKLSATSKQMASLDFSGRCDETRSDELGCLAHNLNCLSDSLSHSMLELQEANAQLKTDIEKERELERQRMDFFGAASHELKTPLTVLKGHLSGMLNGVVGYENHSKYLQRSLAVTEKMEVLIRELLYISRIEKNKTSIQFANIDFAELLRTVIAELTDFISEKKLSLHINIPDRVICNSDSDISTIVLVLETVFLQYFCIGSETTQEIKIEYNELMEFLYIREK